MIIKSKWESQICKYIVNVLYKSQTVNMLKQSGNTKSVILSNKEVKTKKKHYRVGLEPMAHFYKVFPNNMYAFLIKL